MSLLTTSMEEIKRWNSKGRLASFLKSSFYLLVCRPLLLLLSISWVSFRNRREQPIISLQRSMRNLSSSLTSYRLKDDHRHASPRFAEQTSPASSASIVFPTYLPELRLSGRGLVNDFCLETCGISDEQDIMELPEYCPIESVIRLWRGTFLDTRVFTF